MMHARLRRLSKFWPAYLCCCLAAAALAWLTSTSPSPLPADALRTAYFNLDYERGARLGLQLDIEERPDAMAWQVLLESRATYMRPDSTRVDRVRHLPGGSAWAEFALAGALLHDEHRATEALDASERAYLSDPLNVDFVWLRAETLRLRLGGRSAAEFIAQQPSGIQRSMPVMAVSATVLLERTSADRRNDEDFALGLKRIRAATAADPTSATPDYLAGWYLSRAGRSKEARRYLAKAFALSRSPRIFSVYCNAIADSADLDQRQKARVARRAVDRALSRDAQTPELLSLAANTLRELNDFSGADRVERRLLSEYPDAGVAASVKVQRFRTYFLGGVASHSVPTAAHHELLRIADRPDVQESNLPQEATRVLAQALIKRPDAPRHVANEVSNRLVSRFPQYPSRYAIAANLMSAYGDFKEAKRLAQEGLYHAQSLVAAGEFPSEEQRRESLKVIRSELILALGRAQIGEGQLEQGTTSLMTAFELTPTSRSVMFEMGKRYEATQDFRSAQAWFIRCAAAPAVLPDGCRDYLFRLRPHLQPSRSAADFRQAMEAEITRHRASQLALSVEDRGLVSPHGRFETLAGDTIDFRSYRGRIVVLTYWAHWCAVCKIQLPRVDTLARAMAEDRDVVFVTMIDGRQTIAAKDWLTTSSVGLPVLDGRDYMKANRIDSVPTTWFIAEDGRVVFQHVGYIANVPSEFSARIDLIRRKSTRAVQ